MKIREFCPEKDSEFIYRIWEEIGWISGSEDEKKAMDFFFQGSKSLVFELNGEVEGFVNSTPGELRYLKEDLPLNVISAVTVSRVARKQGVAGRLTARAIADAARDGALVSTLGMFEQGFYNRLGYGTGPYEHVVSFDPAELEVNMKPRVPERLTYKDWEAAHKSRLKRQKKHGYCSLFPAQITKAEMYFKKNKGFGLGYYDGPQGELSHFFWCIPEKVGHGPYFISMMVYKNREQFLELMALLKSLGEQVYSIKMIEPAGIQLQDLIKKPFKQRKVRSNSDFQIDFRATAYWQMRILDLKGCLERTRLRGPSLKFNLNLQDPVEKYLEEDSSWRGLTGRYIVELGPASKAEPGFDDNLMTLNASVGAFTRLWLGACPATGLAVTGELAGPEELLEELDFCLSLPQPHVDWDF